MATSETRASIVRRIFRNSFPSWWDRSNNTYNLLYGISEEYYEAYNNISLLGDDISINTATGSYLDDFGKLFKLARSSGETDSRFRARIKSYWDAFTGGGTSDGITNALSFTLGIDSSNISVVENRTYFAVQNINFCESTTNFSAVNDATNVTLDSSVYWQGSGSINFDANSGTDITLRYTKALDITTFENIDYLNKYFSFEAYVPNLTNYSRIEVTFTDSSANYRTYYYNDIVTTGFSTVHIDLTATADDSSGTLDLSDIATIDITFLYSSAVAYTDFRIDNMRISSYDKNMRIGVSITVSSSFDLSLLNDVPNIVDTAKAAGIYFDGADAITLISANSLFLVNLSDVNGTDKV